MAIRSIVLLAVSSLAGLASTFASAQDVYSAEATRRGFRIADSIASETLEVAVARDKYVNELGKIPANQQTLLAAGFLKEIQRVPEGLGGAVIEINPAGQVVAPISGQYVRELCQYVTRRDPDVIGMYSRIPHECKQDGNRTLVIMGKPKLVGRTPLKLAMPAEPLGLQGVPAVPPSMTFLPGEATTLNYFEAGHQHRMLVMWSMPPYQRIAETIIRCQKLPFSPEVLRKRALDRVALAIKAAVVDDKLQLPKPDAAYIYTLTHSAFFLRSLQSNNLEEKTCDLKEIPDWKEVFSSDVPAPPVAKDFGTMTPSHALGLWNLCLKLNSAIDDPYNTSATAQAKVAVASCRKQYRDFVRIEAAARLRPIPDASTLEKEVARQEAGEIVLKLSHQAVLDARSALKPE